MQLRVVVGQNIRAHRERLGLTGSLQWRPSDRLEMSFDLLYGTLSNDRDEFALAPAGVNALTGNVSGTQRLNAIEVRGDTIVYADWSGVDMRNEAKHSEDETAFTQAVYNFEYQPFDSLTVTGLVGYARSEFEGPVFDKVFIQATNQNFGYDFRDGNPATNSYGFDLTDTSIWSLMRADTREDYILSEYTTVGVDAAWRFNEASTLKFGVQHKDFVNEGWQRFQRVGRAGVQVNELMPHMASIIDEMTIVRSMHTSEFNHAPADLFLFTGSPQVGAASMGSWATYGLGSPNQNLPGFVVMVSGRSWAGRRSTRVATKGGRNERKEARAGLCFIM